MSKQLELFPNLKFPKPKVPELKKFTLEKKIKEMVEKNETSLEKLNGRVRQNEQELERLKGISSVAGVIFTGFIAWLFKMKG